MKLRPDIYEVARRLAKRGHRVIVLTSKTYGAPSYEEIENVKIYRISSLALPKIFYFIPSIPQLMTRLLELCKEYDIGIVHFWNYEYLTSILAPILRRKLKNVKLVMTIIGFPGLNWRYGIKLIDLLGLFYTYTIGKIVLKSADHVVLLAKTLAIYALWMGVPTRKISVNSFGLDFQELLPRKTVDEVRRELGISPTDKVVIFVGRLEPVKGIKYLLIAAKRILSKMNNVKFLLVGDGYLRSMLQTCSNPKIIFTGWRKDVPDLLNASDLLVLPSISEGLPLSILEAYATGNPVVATNVGAVNNIVINGHTGLLVSPENGKQLAAAIRYLICHPNLMQEMGTRGKDFVEKNYNWNDTLNRYEELYKTDLYKNAVP